MAAVRLAVGEAPPQLARAIGRPMTLSANRTLLFTYIVCPEKIRRASTQTQRWERFVRALQRPHRR